VKVISVIVKVSSSEIRIGLSTSSSFVTLKYLLVTVLATVVRQSSENSCVTYHNLLWFRWCTCSLVLSRLLITIVLI